MPYKTAASHACSALMHRYGLVLVCLSFRLREATLSLALPMTMSLSVCDCKKSV